MVDLEDLLELQLKEGVLIDVRGTDAHLAILVMERNLCVAELVRDTRVDLAIKAALTWRGRPELASVHDTTVVSPIDGDLVHIHAVVVDRDSLLHQRLYHLLQLLVVVHQASKLVLAEATSAH